MATVLTPSPLELQHTSTYVAVIANSVFIDKWRTLQVPDMHTDVVLMSCGMPSLHQVLQFGGVCRNMS